MTALAGRWRAAVPYVVSGALLLGAGLLHSTARPRLSPGSADELLYYPSGLMARRAALGYETAAADIAWLRGIQYYGEHRITDQNESWELAFETGFLHYVCLHDYASAASYFARASRMPDHPEYVESFAAFANQRAGNAGMAILLWKRVLATGNKYMQEVARRELTRLEGSRGT